MITNNRSQALSVKQYHNFVNNIQEYINKSLKTNVVFAAKKITSSKNIYVLGKGTSNSAALFLTQELKKIYFDKQVDYIVNFVSIENDLDINDLIILISYTASTNDALKVIKSDKQASLLLITANDSIKTDKGNISILKLYPKKEKLFSRPASLISAQIICHKIICQLTNIPMYDKKQINQIVKDKFSQREIITSLAQTENVIVIYNHDNKPFASALSLILNEGICKSSFYFSIDEFIHGWWVPIFAHPSKYIFFVLALDNMSFKKNKDFLLSSKVKTYFLPTINNKELQGLYYLLQIIYLIDNYNQKYNYDLNNPIGKNDIKKIY
ncbi:MAG: SIS domain-containing protein [Mycoplasmataceae bacterium]|jgi:glucosamine 6-phosphate synthetase-like amidotransferase/phosphosugar isomerase protein|nr:SIS domain-containing protein [Mycoplasmataceae bacterium]